MYSFQVHEWSVECRVSIRENEVKAARLCILQTDVSKHAECFGKDPCVKYTHV